MPLPKSVQRAAEAADAMVAAIQAGDQPFIPAGEVELPPVMEPTRIETAPQPTAPVVSDEYEQKYRSLQGKYDSELPVLRSQAQTFERINQSLSAQLAQQAEQLARLEAQARHRPVEPLAPVETNKDIETFGADVIDLINRIAKHHASAAFGEAAQHINAVRGELKQNATEIQAAKASTFESKRATYNTRLTELVPDWREINASEGFLTWLGEVDPLLGRTRQAAVSEAFVAFNAEWTAEFLRAYKKLTAATRPTNPVDELRRQAAPNSSRGSATPPASETAVSDTKIWTGTEIADFFKLVVQGKFRGHEEERASLEAQINLAVQQGRVR
jgi:hypothetical protein